MQAIRWPSHLNRTLICGGIGLAVGRQTRVAHVPSLTSCGVSHTCRSCVAWALITGGKSVLEYEHHSCTCSLAVATEQRALFLTCYFSLGDKGRPQILTTHRQLSAWSRLKLRVFRATGFPELHAVVGASVCWGDITDENGEVHVVPLCAI